jgi:uncharacterized paraquat-inducible protein A
MVGFYSSGAGTAYLSRAHMSWPLFFSEVHVVQSLFFCIVFCQPFFVLLSIVLSVLQITSSHYPFSIFKSFYILFCFKRRKLVTTNLNDFTVIVHSIKLKEKQTLLENKAKKFYKSNTLVFFLFHQFGLFFVSL